MAPTQTVAVVTGGESRTLEAYPVSRRVNRAAEEGPECVQPLVSG